MGVDYSGKLMVGLPYDDIDWCNLEKYLLEEFHEVIDEDDNDYWSMLDQADLTSASPYYDADISDCIIGFELPDLELTNRLWVEVIESKREQFKLIFGKTPKLIGAQHIW